MVSMNWLTGMPLSTWTFLKTSSARSGFCDAPVWPRVGNTPKSAHAPMIRIRMSNGGGLTLQVMIEVQEPAPVIFPACGRFFDRVVIGRNDPGKVCPRLGKHDRIFHGGLIHQVIVRR